MDLLLIKVCPVSTMFFGLLSGTGTLQNTGVAVSALAIASFYETSLDLRISLDVLAINISFAGRCA